MLQQLGAALPPELLGQLGSRLGVDTNQVSECMGAVTPVVLGSLSKQASTPGGAEALFAQLSQAGGNNPLGSLIGALGNMGDSGGGGNPLAGMLGTLLSGAGGASGPSSPPPAAGASGGNPVASMLGTLLGGGGGAGSGSTSAGTGGGNPILGMLGTLLGGAGSAPPQRDPLTMLLGDKANTISATLSERLGFDVRPLLTLAVPMIAGVINRAIKSGNLNANNLQQFLASESSAVMQQSTNPKQEHLAKEVLAACDQADALRARFSDSEWAQVQQAPLAATYIVADASAALQDGAPRELGAASAAVLQAANQAQPISLLRIAFGAGLNQADFRDFTAQTTAAAQALAQLRSAMALVARHTPDERAAFGTLVVSAAEQAAAAVSEGGFMGIGGTRVNAAEQQALQQIREVCRDAED
ncbi:DUF937 domain-containing protein [Candidatus Viridilinea mediisalina]|uniref:DUF937 domain-containing protein n=1 Tax=Candidatus Viridilinea mediisalina TaxID=2024553 RepID=A0A2A6RK95_9CHLR|nr:DUF937 domain-containing protein [Candidatus Viridilinea mediisalina]PDW03290.1 hypothetical protein CJ255_09595 [Candidatus Viridilinea mediisalina]